MAWKDTLQDASFRGVKFDCVRIEDTIDSDVSRFAVPYVDGEDIEDLGRRARGVSITAVFFGDDYEDRLKTFLNALSQHGSGELIHPVFGSLTDMQFLGAHVTHEAESPDSCFVEMQFARAKPGNPFFTGQLASQAADAAAQVAQTAQDSGVSVFATAVSALSAAKAGLRRLNALRDLLGSTLGPIKNLVTGFQATALDYIDFPRGFASDLIGLVGGMGDLRSFDIGMVMADWSTLFDQSSAVLQLPSSTAAGQTVTLPGTQVAIATASSQDTQVPRAIPADPDDIATLQALVTVVVATTLAQTASDVLANEAEEPTLTADEIEQITSNVRTLIQSAIDDQRATQALVDARTVTEPLKDTALAIQQLAVNVIDLLPPVVTRTVNSRTNLTLLAFNWYGDYTRSSELLRLNPSLRNPNFIERGEVLRAYAT